MYWSRFACSFFRFASAKQLRRKICNGYPLTGLCCVIPFFTPAGYLDIPDKPVVDYNTLCSVLTRALSLIDINAFYEFVKSAVFSRIVNRQFIYVWLVCSE